ncbi:MAG: vWA domain-containing protein [Cyanobacteriota bacterium]|nr:vWA domain-containing protein [Cyanobacteriota bacterium]
MSTTIVSWIPKVSLSLLLVICGINPSFAEVERVEIIQAKPDKDNGSVTLRFQAFDRNNKAVMRLPVRNVTLRVCSKGDRECQELELGNKKWRKRAPEELPPAWVIVLLDFSGSMRRCEELGSWDEIKFQCDGKSKLEGAIEAIQKFNEDVARRSKKTQIAIVPFSESGGRCVTGKKVNRTTLDEFKPAGSDEIEKTLDELRETAPKDICGATNIYDPLIAAVRFLGDENEPRFNPPEPDSQEKTESKEPEPRLSIILLSDGYHSIYGKYGEREAKMEQGHFGDLILELEKNSHVTVNTIGYGKTSQELKQEYGLKDEPNMENLYLLKDLPVGDVTNHEGLKQISQEFVDRKSLTRIAEITRGIHEFSANANDVANALTDFLSAMLNEYEITYVQPTNFDRGSAHNVQVIVKPPDGGEVKSKPEPYTFSWVGPKLPAKSRGILFLSVLAMVLGGIFVPFWLFKKSLQ